MATSYEVREELTGILARDLLGPKDADIEPDATDMTLGDGADEGDAGPQEIAPLLSPQAGGRIWASSMGLSFCVGQHVSSIAVTAEWGRYRKAESQRYLRDDGAGGRIVWKRHPVSKTT